MSALSKFNSLRHGWLAMVLNGGSAVAQVYKHKPKKHYQRKTGHRQPLSKFLVTKIAQE
jgi:ribosomal protein L21